MPDNTDLIVPQLGESITEAVIGRWLKQVGEPIEADEPVVDLETDKITVQLPSPVAGALTEQRFAEGDTVRVGDIVGLVGPAGASTAAAAAPAPAATAPVAPAPVAPAPAASAPVAPAPAAPAPVAPAPAPRAGAPTDFDTTFDFSELARLSPAQRRVAREQGQLPTGAKVETPAVARPATPVAAVPAPAAAVPAAPPAAARVTASSREDIVKMSPLRKRIAERLVTAQTESASLTTFNEVDMSAVMELRNRYKDAFAKEHGVKLGFLSFFVKACVAACKMYPGINAEVRGDSIVYKKHYDFGIAVGTERGLVVPVVRDCDSRDFAGIEGEIAALADKARTNKLVLDDLVGGTFSITNGGIYGSMLSTPLLNYPQTAILGMHNIVKRAVVVGDAVEVRPIMYIALTYDHRVVDGREAVQFLVAVKERLEAPDRLMLGV